MENEDRRQTQMIFYLQYMEGTPQLKAKVFASFSTFLFLIVCFS